MDSGLWIKLQQMASQGDRVVVVEGGEAFVLLPLGDYERLRSGEASLQRFVAPEPVIQSPLFTEHRSLENGPAGLWEPLPHRGEQSFTVEDTETGTDGEDEERFYLEPVD